MLATQPIVQERTGLPEPPLCVDLDKTLVATDLLWESVAALARRNPLWLLLLPVWLLRGKAHLKAQLAARVQLDPATLPYRQDVLLLLFQERAQGRRLVLATASHRRLADAVAAHLGLFDEVLASDEQHNLKGHAKRRALVARFGVRGFDYIGDSPSDLPLWQAARAAWLVSPGVRLLRQAQACSHVKGVLGGPDRTLRSLRRVVRPHQWAKNLLLFVPLVLAHQFTELASLWAVCCALAAFSCCASAVYILNDILDLEGDRKHPTKRNRPLASGALSIPRAAAACLALLTVGFSIPAAAGLAPGFLGMLGFYVALTTAYSFWLKRIALVDVLVLAGLYAHRVLAGGVAAEVGVSGWLMAFSMFFFVSLALAKRYAELVRVAAENRPAPERRGYLADDLELIQSLGPATGCMAILTFCLYVNAADVLRLYRSPHLLWGIGLVLFYWIARVWLLARRRLLNEDPITFAIRDPASYVSGLAVLAVLLVAAHW